ncbi:transmembrane amino acid transporter protein-domain-containing protein [Thelonectria olida]|uniref:Transmembrane amino acid transporter protein-domain-containing protein n=1 Tax=Thelonectria olida TaxID=1576542 RepID=A0A9P8VW16_9HYPO|nr:transmembrane amino acid transporter protein-domain-containing protein [Thelonectria olida]
MAPREKEIKVSTRSVPPESISTSDESVDVQTTDHGQGISQQLSNRADGAGADLDQGFRTMGLRETVSLLLTNQVGLGVLSLPSVLKTLGLFPGTLAIVGLGGLSWYTAFELKLFYDRHPHVLNVADMARVVGGRGFECVVACGMILLVIMTAASAVVTFSVALKLLSSEALSSVVFIALGCICCWVLCIPRTARFVSRSGIASCLSILTATVVVMVSLGTQRPADAPAEWRRQPVWFAAPSFRDGLNACLKICYAFSGNVSFPSYMAEMRNPKRDFKAALLWLEVTSMAFYSIVAVCVYCLACEYTTSPALGSASPRSAHIAYGLVIPSVLSKGLAFGQTGIKYVYLKVMRRFSIQHEMATHTTRSWSIWLGLVTLFWIATFGLSVAIPDFDSILSMTSAVTISWFTFGLSAIFWLHMSWSTKFATWRQVCLTALNVCLIFSALFLNAAGLWSSSAELRSKH